LSRRPVTSPDPGEKLPIRRVDASCSAAVVSKVIDRDPVSRWYCGTQNGEEALTADLGEAMTVGAVRHGLGPYAADFPRELVIDTSIDGASWQPAWRGNVVARVIFAAFEEPRWPVMVLSFAPRSARYVRLRQVAQDRQVYWSVAELEVFGSGSN
jgi:F5/8 type C domain-containing protein